MKDRPGRLRDWASGSRDRFAVHRLSAREIAWALAASAFFLAAYLLNCSHYAAIAGDSPEMVGGAYSLGVVHPPGFPLYVLLGFVASHLPFGSVAFRVNLLSSLFHAATLCFLCLSLIKMTGRPAPALVATAALGLAYPFFFYALVAEAFPLNDLLCALLLFAAILVREGHASGDERRTGRRLLALAFLVGLGLSNHHTIVLVLPGVFLLVLRPLVFFAGKLRMWLLSAAALALGLLPYAYIPLRASGHPYINFRDPSTPRAFLDFVLRRYYGSYSLGLGQPSGNPFTLVADFFSVLYHEFWIIGLVLGAAGAVWLAWKRSGYFAPLAASFFFSGIVFPVMMNTRITSAWHASILGRFYLLPTVLFAFFLGAGADALLRGVEGLSSRRGPMARYRAILSLAAALLLVLPFARNFGANACRTGIAYDFIGESYVENLLSGVEEGSVLILSGDIPVELVDCYYQVVAGEKKDFVSIVLGFLGEEWYLRQLARHYPGLRVFMAEDAPQGLAKDDYARWGIARLMEQNPDRAFYIYPAIDAGGLPCRQIPEGLAYRMVPEGEELDHQAYFLKQWYFWGHIDDRGLPVTLHPAGSLEESFMATYPQLLGEAGDFLWGAGRPGMSAGFYGQALEYAPNPDLALKRAFALLEAGSPGEAREAFELYLEYAPNPDPAALEALRMLEGGGVE